MVNMVKNVSANLTVTMKKILIIAGLAIASTLAVTVVDLQPTLAGQSLCQNTSNRGAYCLRYGDRGPLVYRLIEDLRCAGYYNVGNDSWFGPVTDGAVRRLQRDHGLPPDGIVGPQTNTVIERLCSSQGNSTAQADLTLRPGSYEQPGSKYIFIFESGGKYCYSGHSRNGRTVASVNKISSNPPIYEIFNFGGAQLRQKSSGTLIFGNSEYTFKGRSYPHEEELNCLRANGNYHKSTPYKGWREKF